MSNAPKAVPPPLPQHKSAVDRLKDAGFPSVAAAVTNERKEHATSLGNLEAFLAKVAKGEIPPTHPALPKVEAALVALRSAHLALEGRSEAPSEAELERLKISFAASLANASSPANLLFLLEQFTTSHSYVFREVVWGVDGGQPKLYLNLPGLLLASMHFANNVECAVVKANSSSKLYVFMKTGRRAEWVLAKRDDLAASET